LSSHSLWGGWFFFLLWVFLFWVFFCLFGVWGFLSFLFFFFGASFIGHGFEVFLSLLSGSVFSQTFLFFFLLPKRLRNKSLVRAFYQLPFSLAGFLLCPWLRK